jgi:hypothetical protein
MPSDDEVVMLYLEMANLLQESNRYQALKWIKTIETTYESEADTDLGEFLNDMTYVLLNQLHDPELHSVIRDHIYDSELDYTMLFEIGSTLLSDLYIMIRT